MTMCGNVVVTAHEQRRLLEKPERDGVFVSFTVPRRTSEATPSWDTIP
jgi:hypothetical protein